MAWDWGKCMDKSTDWAFKKAGGFGKFNGWGSATASTAVGIAAVPACVVGGFFVGK